MARLGGITTESFSSARERLSTASVGLGSILRDQIVAVPAGTGRINVLLGLSSSQSSSASRSLINSPAHSLSSSPVEPNGFLDVDDSAELKDEDLWPGIDMNENGSTYSHEPMHRLRLPAHACELGSKHTQSGTLSNSPFSNYHGYGSSTHSHSQKHGIGRTQLDSASKQPVNMRLDGACSSQYHLLMDKSPIGPIDVTSSNAGLMRRSPLSKVSESHSVYQRHQALTASCSIPQVPKHTILHDSSLHSAAHQSAPVNVPNWSRILQKDTTAINFNSVHEEIAEDDDIEKLPPHEMLAKEYARHQTMTSSVCEGQGRTLKGRDMRRVRNAVWRQTGFAD